MEGRDLRSAFSHYMESSLLQQLHNFMLLCHRKPHTSIAASRCPRIAWNRYSDTLLERHTVKKNLGALGQAPTAAACCSVRFWELLVWVSKHATASQNFLGDRWCLLWGTD